jgi:hypothetical protein
MLLKILQYPENLPLSQRIVWFTCRISAKIKKHGLYVELVSTFLGNFYSTVGPYKTKGIIRIAKLQTMVAESVG